MLKKFKKLMCYVLSVFLLMGIHFYDYARASFYEPSFSYPFCDTWPTQYVDAQANNDNYDSASGKYIATAECYYFYGSHTNLVMVWAPNKKTDNTANKPTYSATIQWEDEYDMRYANANPDYGEYVQFKGAYHKISGNPIMYIRVRG